MLNKRYHVFLSLSGAHMHTEHRLLQQALVSVGCFGWGLEQRSPLTKKLAMRQIDDCDYVLLMVDDQYGDQAMTGHSYQQLEYEYALSQGKPILVVMTDTLYNGQICSGQTAGQQQLQQQFLTQVMQQDSICRYRNVRELELTVRHNMQQMLERHPVVGWVRPQFLQALQDEIDALQLKVSLLEQQKAAIPTGSDAPTASAQVSMQQSMLIEYRIHAYQDGNFQELRLQRHLTWAQLLSILAPTFCHPNAEDYFSLRLSAYFNETGLLDAQKDMPRAHAVARAQVNIRSLHHIKTHMQQYEWIVPQSRDERQRMLWQVTEKAQKLMQQMPSDLTF